MARIIAIANQKGGVGKTTTAVNLAAALAATPKRVLLVDLDAQGNATMGVGVDKRELEASTCDVLLEEVHAEVAIVPTEEGLDLMPGNTDLTAAEIELMDEEGREQRLKRALDGLRDRYDYILIDCPPALSLLTLNALTAADAVLVPMQCEYYALEGLTALLQTIEALKAKLNPALEIEGVLRTMFDVRNNLANAVSGELTTHFGDKVFRTIVPRNVRLAEAPSHGQSIVGYDKGSRGAVAYLGLAGELMRRQREREQSKPAATPSTSTPAAPTSPATSETPA
ncbi:ParA family protein [Luteimonas aquatica]|uniref:ParA family protein n=1 Tax=Luteimonas aquatica TaxID=450364 RepID=UPI001F58704F|nr:AAA family ATPase [Luteimonas aquatica]